MGTGRGRAVALVHRGRGRAPQPQAMTGPRLTGPQGLQAGCLLAALLPLSAQCPLAGPLEVLGVLTVHLHGAPDSRAFSFHGPIPLFQQQSLLLPRSWEMRPSHPFRTPVLTQRVAPAGGPGLPLGPTPPPGSEVRPLPPGRRLLLFASAEGSQNPDTPTLDPVMVGSESSSLSRGLQVTVLHHFKNRDGAYSERQWLKFWRCLK